MIRPNAVLLSLIVMLAAALRCYSLSTLGYWTDEFCTLSNAQGHGLELVRVPFDQSTGPTLPVTRLVDARPITEVAPNLARDDSHPPLYFLVVRLFEEVFGDGESSVRSVGVIASVATVVLIYVAAARTVGTAAALRAALIAAVAVPQIQFAQEARNYMPAVAMSMAAVVAFLRLRGQARDVVFKQRSVVLFRPAAIFFAVALLAMVLTHYYTASIALGLAGYASFASRGRARRDAMIAIATAAILFVALWGRQAIFQSHTMGSRTSWLQDNGPGHSVRTLQRLCLVPVRLTADLPKFGRADIWIAIGGAGILSLVPLWFRRRDLRFWIVLAVAPVLVVVAVDLANHSRQLFWLRYTLLASPAIYVLIAACVRTGRFRYVPSAVAIVLSILSLRSAYVPDWKIDFRTPVESVGSRLKPGDALVIAGPDKTFVAITKTAFDHYLPAQPSMTLLLTRPPTKSEQAEIATHPAVWIVWMWPDRSIDGAFPDETLDDRGTIPGFAELASGRPKTTRR